MLILVQLKEPDKSQYLLSNVPLVLLLSSYIIFLKIHFGNKRKQLKLGLYGCYCCK